MEFSNHHFELKKASEIFPRPTWPFFVLLILLYYASVVFEFQLLFVGLMTLVLFFLLFRSSAASRCLVSVSPETLTVEYTKGLFGISVLKTEYAWKDLESYQWKAGTPELQLTWTLWDATYYFGKDLEPFRDYLRTHYPGKETT